MQGIKRLMIPLSMALTLCATACSFDTAGPGVYPPDSEGPLPPLEAGPEVSVDADLDADLNADLEAGLDADLDVGLDAVGDSLPQDTLPMLDSTIDLPHGVFLDENFASGQGEVTFERGDWVWEAAGGGGIRQTSMDEYGNYAAYDAPNGNMGAETRLIIHAIQDISGVSEGAGLAFRLQRSSPPGGQPAMAFCFLSPDGNSLAIVISDGSSVDVAPSDSVPFNSAVGFNYRLRGELINQVLHCEIVGQDKRVEANVGPGGGNVGLATIYADVTFLSLKVYQPPL